MLGTMSNGDSGSTSKDLQVVQAVMANASAKTVPSVMGLQWGMLDLYEGKTGGVSPSTFNTGNMPVWATEHKCGNYPWNPSGYPAYKEPAPNNQAYAVESWGYIVDAINKGGVTAYNAWNMVLDSGGKGNDMIRQWAQDTLLVVNGTSLVLTPTYHVFRHASQYVQVGAKVVSGRVTRSSRSRIRTAASSRSFTTRAAPTRTTSSKSRARSTSSRCPAPAGRPSSFRRGFRKASRRSGPRTP